MKIMAVMTIGAGKQKKQCPSWRFLSPIRLVPIPESTVPAISPNGILRLIIIDQILPDVYAGAFPALPEIVMMGMEGMERTEKQWRTLLEEVGLQVFGLSKVRTGTGRE